MKQNRVKNLVLKGWLAAALLASARRVGGGIAEQLYDVSVNCSSR